MNDFYLFNKTVRGYSHITREIPCEDSSGTYKNKLYYIFTIADGHGDSTCFRSKIGSKLAVESAIECLKDFSNNYEEEPYKLNEMLEDPDNKNKILKKITETIINVWNEKVQNDLNQNPVTEEEINQYCKDSSATQELYLSGKCLNHIYGTTLIAGLQIYNYLILIQQGDGRCELFYEDGTVSQPIPWDDRCETNVTTSMCDKDAKESIRYYVIDIEKMPIAACFVGSDGIEDSYRDMEGTHCFYRTISLKLLEDKENFESYLENTLSQLSQCCSSDDMSVSGIIDLKKIDKIKKFFEDKVSKYDLCSKIEKLETLINSKTRKHEILQKRKEDFEQEYEESTSTLKNVESEIVDLEERSSAIDKEIDTYKEIIAGKDIKKKKIFFKVKQKENIKKANDNIKDNDGLSRTKKLYNEKLENKIEEKKMIQNMLNTRYEKRKQLNAKIDELHEKKESIYREFEEYDNQYQELKEQYNNLTNQTESL